MSGKRNWEKIEREQSEKEKSQSEERERTIAELFRAIEQLESSKKQPGEGILADARELAAQWKVKKRPLFEGLLENNRLALLVALVVALRSSHQCLEKTRRYFPNELENLISTSGHREFRAFVSALSGTLPEPPPNRKYERKRRRWRWGDKGEIERQFGKDTSAVSTPFAYPADCLDDVFAGAGVNMLRLEELFGMDGKRFPEELRSFKDGTKRLYDCRAVVKIMPFLLSERLREKRKGPGRPKALWLSDPDLLTRALSGIEARRKGIANVLLSIALEKADFSKLTDKELALVRTVFEHFRGYAEWQKKIADPFLAVVRRHLRNSGKK
jgi:hypothetical protein